MTDSPRRVAIVGGGIAGMACSWELRKHSARNVRVDIYESASKLGGHANSVPFKGNGTSVDVDTGFIVMDEATYPRFKAFLGDLGIETIPTDMSFGVSTTDRTFEWSSCSVGSFVATLTLLLSPWVWRLMFDIVRFSLFAEDILYERGTTPRRGEEESCLMSTSLESIGSYLTRRGYSSQFTTYFLIPMVAAPWCIDPDEFSRSFPARPLIHFMKSHGLLDTVTKTLQWRSFRNGSRTYIDAFQDSLPQRHKLHLNTSVHDVTRIGNEVLVSFSDGSAKTFDHVVLAVHANQAVTLLGDNATALERRILGSFKTSRNICYLHSDTSLLPERPSARAAWNCTLVPHQSTTAQDHLTQNEPKCGRKLSLTFDMNKLQGIPSPGEPGSPGRVLVSMNPIHVPCSVQSSHVYHHPIINSECILMTRHLHKINGTRNISFAGAWMGFGFHEDGFAAGVHAARTFMDGWDKIPPLDLIGDTRGMRPPRTGFLRAVLRLGVLVVQQLLHPQPWL
ncbi:hypothetical protein J3459_011585 [Metarhizium acridum]|nr:hypothetical protein J3459_011585 [Metarhizium acridum]